MQQKLIPPKAGSLKVDILGMEGERFYSENMDLNEPEESNYPAGVEDIKEEFFRSGGKGGQNVNKVESGVRLRASIAEPVLLERLREIYPSSVTKDGEFLVTCTEERTQEQNLRIARERLMQRLDIATQQPTERIPTKIPRSSRRERLDTKRKHSVTKDLRKPPQEW
ncbi:MAG: hypothetical protein UT82_C0003G0014 [Parcubacteria group bacterium GW2011_GWB1_40_14]|nr:MAG: hypothetical protein UT82_C0003G0014 [Parcubacteria group bacterium GW2011_GWB1_40_14]